ncbi:hypothetical protein M9H77_08078 [Catharanthus roseus]|uniref:Uncharacterized protein n=1 Tax=Catharanthus roseus TaxID=4058 RepID=A0ACC0BX54_CATRO|nr:hypothetical protein M9H77_08078 [Catharanthus roseus]
MAKEKLNGRLQCIFLLFSYSCFCLFSVNSSVTTAVSHHFWLTTYLKKKRKSVFQTSHPILKTRKKFDLSGVWCLLHSTSDTDVIRNLPGCFPDSWELFSSMNLAHVTITILAFLSFKVYYPANWASVHTFSLLSLCSLIPVMSWTEPHNPNRIHVCLIQDVWQAGFLFLFVLCDSFVTVAVSHHFRLTTYLKKKRKSIFQASHPILKSID